MKRTLSIILTTLLLSSLVACGNSSTNDVQAPTSVSTNGVTDTEPSNAPEPTLSEDSSSLVEPEVSNNQTVLEEQEISITETVLVDEAGVKITAKSLNLDGFMGAELNLLIENNSGKDLTFQSRNASVNGYMVETMMSVDIVDGKRANDTLIFLNSDLEACGIETIADMEFSFHIFTSADWDEYLDTAQIQLKTTIADTFEYTFDSNGHIAFDENGIKIVVKGLSEDDSIFGPGIIVYIENNSNQNITVQTRDVSVNGFMVTPIFSSDVIIGKHAIDSITFLSSELEENAISTFETIELSFHIFDLSDWQTIVDTDVVTITF